MLQKRQLSARFNIELNCLDRLKMNFYKRHQARKLALQAIYEWQISGNDPAYIESRVLEDCKLKKIDVEYFRELVRGVTVGSISEIDKHMLPYLDRKITELNPTELAVMRLAIYELVNCLDVPYKVIINEALELTKKFGAVEGYKYVNGVLDKVAKDIRTV